MQLASFYQPGKFGLSFELYPPKTPQGERLLYENVGELMEFDPDFVTCTYGAGGSTRDKTLEIVCEVKRRFGKPVASHLTVVGADVDELRDYLRQATEREIDFVVALRGDPPRGEIEFRQAAGGLRYANELVSLIRAEFQHFGVAVAGYPETHQEAISPDVDLENLKRKVDAGADVVITQLFYNNDDFWRFRERYDRAGLTAPLVPGILPVTNLSQIQRIASLCGALLPESFVARMSKKDDDDQWQFEAGVEFATEQVQQLIAGGIPGIHFYVLNKSPATAAVLRAVSRDAARNNT